MNKKNVTFSKEDIELVNGKVIINSDELASEIEGMNIVGDSLIDDEGGNSISVTVTKS